MEGDYKNQDLSELTSISNINVEHRLLEPRNSLLSEEGKDYFLRCLNYLYQGKTHTIKLILDQKLDDQKKCKTHQVRLTNLVRDKGKPEELQSNSIVEFAAICVHLILLPFLFDYDTIKALKKFEKADYMLIQGNLTIVLECKGSNSKNTCKTQINSAIKQTEESIEHFMGLNRYKDTLKFGIASTTCFVQNENHFIVIPNKVFAESMGNKMYNDYIKKLIEESSRLIMDGEIAKAENDPIKAQKIYKEAANKELEVASALYESDSEFSRDHWISALSCYFEAGMYKEALMLLNDLQEKVNFEENDLKIIEKIKSTSMELARIKIDNELSASLVKQIIRWIMLETEKKFGKIRGKFTIMKIMFFFREQALEFGTVLPVDFFVSRNPIFSIELSKEIEWYLESHFLKRNPDKTLNISKKGRYLVESEEDVLEEILEIKFSYTFIHKIIGLIEDLGDKTSDEVMEIERSRGITPYQYRRPLI